MSATTTSRRIVCTACAQTVRVYELPRPYIDPVLFVCGRCLEPSSAQQTLPLEPPAETRRYDPATAAIPY